MSRNNAKIKSEAPVLTSPEGEKIQITAGRKLQEIRSYAEDPEVTDAQFRALVCVIDRLNEGRSGDESRWGSAYPNYETLAKDIAKDERAAKRIIKELKTGRREIRSKSGERKLVPCKAVLNVKSTKKGKSDEVNEYRLKNWGAFAVAPAEGAVTGPQQSEKGPVTGQEGCGDPSKGVRSPARKGAVTAPDSSHLPSPEKHLTNPPQHAPASGERVSAAAVCGQEEDGSLPMWASHPQGLLAQDWTWNDREFRPAIDLLGFDEFQLDAEIDRFIAHHRGERRHDWNPVWLEWIQALNTRQSSDSQPEQVVAGDYEEDDLPF